MNVSGVHFCICDVIIVKFVLSIIKFIVIYKTAIFRIIVLNLKTSVCIYLTECLSVNKITLELFD